jgi:hypothetical protein
VQLSGAQVVPGSYLRQPVAPSHLPSVPQLLAPLSTQTLRGSTTPAGTGVQRPMAEGRAQLRQAPAQAPSQQTPSTQKLLTHSPAAVHGWPLGLGPQLPLWQTWPATQSASAVQRAMQAPSLHRYGAQLRTPGAWQRPRPSQVPAVLSRAPLHDAGTQTVSAA